MIKYMILQETKKTAENFVFFTAYAELYLWIHLLQILTIQNAFKNL